MPALRYTDTPVPVPGADEVLIRVHAASVTAADCLLMRGEPSLVRLAFGLRAPRVAVRGRDAAGVVVGVGSAVRRFAVNDEVYAEVTAGRFAQFTVATEKVVAHKPTTLTFEQAATVPLAGTTALQGLRHTAKLQPGDRVLVNGASGGVGTFAAQIAKAFGAEVTAVCSTRNAELARHLGADHVIDHSIENFTVGDRRHEVNFDLIDNHSLSACRRALTPRGTLVLSAGAGGRLFGLVGRILAATTLGLFSSRRLRSLVASASAADLDVLRALIDAGTVTPQIETTYPLSHTIDALRHFGEQHARGKIAISIDSAGG